MADPSDAERMDAFDECMRKTGHVDSLGDVIETLGEQVLNVVTGDFVAEGLSWAADILKERSSASCWDLLTPQQRIDLYDSIHRSMDRNPNSR